MEQQAIIDEIEAYCARARIRPSTFGVKAVGNSRLLERLKRRVTEAQRVSRRVRSFIAENPPPADLSNDPSHPASSAAASPCRQPSEAD